MTGVPPRTPVRTLVGTPFKTVRNCFRSQAFRIGCRTDRFLRRRRPPCSPGQKNLDQGLENLREFMGQIPFELEVAV